MSKRKILVLFFHPRFEESKANSALVQAIPKDGLVTFWDVYEQYPDFDIDVKKEQTLLLTHDVIVWQHPFYWYSCPPLMKQWIEMAITTISMIISPLLLFLNEKFILPAIGTKETESRQEADPIAQHSSVILAGFGHFGSTIGRFLRANGVYATILDNDNERVDLLRKMGFTVFYGDATRLDLLQAAGADKAKVFISAIDSPEKAQELVDVLQRHFPNLQLFMRSKNRYDAYELLDRGVENVYRESVHSSVALGVDVLTHLGLRKYTLQRKAASFIKYDEAALKKLGSSRHEKEAYILGVRQEIELQEKLLQEDRMFADNRQDTAWDSTRRSE